MYPYLLCLTSKICAEHYWGGGLERGEPAESSSCRRRQGAGLGHRTPAGGPGWPREAPRCSRRLARGRKGRDQGLQRVAGHPGALQERPGAGLQGRAPSTGQAWGLLASETP